MRRSSEPEERAQFTVAELLARYGDPAAPNSRRHRRAASEADAVASAAAQPATERSWTPGRDQTSRPADPLLPPRPANPQPHPAGQHGTSFWGSPHREATQREVFVPPRNGNAGRRNGERGWSPAVSSPPASVPVTPAPPARPAPPNRVLSPDGPSTDRLPRINAPLAQPPTRPSRPPERPGSPEQTPPPAGIKPPAGQAQPADPSGSSQMADRQRSEPTPAEEALTQAETSGSALWEWFLMVSQIGIGVVGGAALWLICEWLWQRIPVVALAVALVVITGLVWVVRRLRRAEDLQTTVIAVLVGLFVTVSPAALLLIGR